MNAMTCNEVQEQLDLLAADACEPAVRTALESHLRDCKACAAVFAESQRVTGLLEIYFNDNAIERLRQRTEQPARPVRQRAWPFVRGGLAAAAVVLVAIGLVWWSPSNNEARFEPTFAMVVHARKVDDIVPGPEKLPAALKTQNAEVMVAIPQTVRGDDFRESLIKAKRAGKLLLPPAVSLDMELVNTSKRTVEIRPGESILELDVGSNGVLRMDVPNAEEPDFLHPATVQLDQGEKYIIRIDRLIAGSRGKLEYVYLTKPGDYELTARLRINVAGKTIVVSAPPVRIGVVTQSP
jgi:hypothetical protein